MKEAIIYTCSINIQQYLTCLKNISGECVRQMTETGKRRRTVNVLSKKTFFCFPCQKLQYFCLYDDEVFYHSEVEVLGFYVMYN